MDEVSVVIRSFQPGIDEAFIYSTWRNAAYYGGIWSEEDKPYSKYFFKMLTISIRDILPFASIRIACLQDDPMTIIGYSVTMNKNLEFIYVKIEYRKKGIGTLLMPKDIETVSDDLTKIGKVIAEKKNLKIKENRNGSTGSESSGESSKDIKRAI